MPEADIIIVFDCGATNVRAVPSTERVKLLHPNHIPIIHGQIHTTLLTGSGM